MKKALLLGNGMNNRLNIKGMSSGEIKDRFLKNILKYGILFEQIFDVSNWNEIPKYIIENTKDDGIELLAGCLYDFIKSNRKNRWTDNHEYRLQDTVACISILSIFYNEDGRIKADYQAENLFDMSEYDDIFTLNYMEFWDRGNRCTHLHGKIDYNELCEGKNVILLNEARLGAQEYKNVVDQMKQNYLVHMVNSFEIVFAPSSIPKEKLICVQGLYPSDNLFPAGDLDLISPKTLYKDLSTVEEIDLFGVSPYGEKSLIDIINQKKYVRIFIFQKETSKETDEWKKILTGRYELLDSSEIK